jgi:hypothetical protein
MSGHRATGAPAFWHSHVEFLSLKRTPKLSSERYRNVVARTA